jgi:NADPH:quinone reductase-like Zn-dependent oxidoreductase
MAVTMKAICRDAYGSPEVLELREIEKPAPAEDEVLVRIRAASVNPLDWHSLVGTPYLLRLQEGLRHPKSQRVGTDFAGTVEVAGKAVERFRPGDDVFGIRDGALAEYVCIRGDRVLAVKPAGVSFEQAASVPIAGVTALQGLREKGGLQPGQRVVVNGASGGVGTFAVEIAKALGAEVTAVCSTRNVDQARALGADRVIDYTRDDFTRTAEPCDVLLDIAGNRSWRDCRRVLAPGGTLVAVGGPKRNRLIGPLGNRFWLKLRSVPGDRRVTLMLAKVTREELEFLGRLLEDGSVTPVVERTYGLAETAQAFDRLGQGHAQGKLVVTV